MAGFIADAPQQRSYHFFSPTYSAASTTEEFFLRNVVEQLAALHGEVLAPVSYRGIHDLRAAYFELIRRSPATPAVLMLDGLDEVATFSLREYLERPLAPNLVILTTIRDTGQDWRAEYGFPAHQLRHLQIVGLDRSGVAAVLNAAGGGAAQFATDTGLLDQIVRVAAVEGAPEQGADPLYLRFLAEDARDGLLTPDNLADQPVGLTAYVRRWWKQLDLALENTREDLQPGIEDLLATLAVALGPIGRQDLERLHPSLRHARRKDHFERVVAEVRRWVVRTPDDSYALAHPRLRDILAEHFDTGDCLDALLTHCVNWEEFSSAHIRAYHAQHLARTGRKAELYELIDKRWFYHLTQHTGSYTAFVADAELAANAAAQEWPIHWYEFLRCSLIIARLVSVSGSIPMAALVAIIHLGQFKRALGFAALIGDNKTRVDAFVGLIRAHLFAGASDKRSQLVSMALATARGIEDAWIRAWALAGSAAAQAQTGAVAEALDAARTIANASSRTRALAEVVSAGAYSSIYVQGEPTVLRVVIILRRLGLDILLDFLANVGADWAWIEGGDILRAFPTALRGRRLALN